MKFKTEQLQQIAHDLTVEANQYDQDAQSVEDLDTRLVFPFREARRNRELLQLIKEMKLITRTLAERRTLVAAARRQREAAKTHAAVAALVAGPEFAHVPGCYYVVRCDCDCAHYANTTGTPRLVDRTHAETFGSALNAAWVAHQWGGGARVERVVPAGGVDTLRLIHG